MRQWRARRAAVRTRPKAPPALLQRDGEGRFRVSGAMRLDNAASLLALGVAAFAGRASVEVDLAQVSDADSAGLAVLIEWTRQARLQDRHIVFNSMPPRLARMARIGGVADLLPQAG